MAQCVEALAATEFHGRHLIPESCPLIFTLVLWHAATPENKNK